MDYRELRSFVLLSGQLHFGKASNLLHLSQPALTKQIRRLEEELGSPLFLRGKQGTSLTTFGQHFLQEAKPVLAAFEKLFEKARQEARGETGTLNIGFGFHTLNLVPQLLVKFRRHHPGVELSLRDFSTTEQVEGLRNHQIDLGFVRLPAPPEFLTMPVIQDRLALVSSENSALPANTTLKDFRDQPFVAISEKRSPGFYRHMLILCAKYGFHPKVVQEVTEFTTAVALVRAGMGICIVPQSFWSTRPVGIRLHPIQDKEAQWKVGAIWRKKDSNPALASFLNLLKLEIRK